MVGETPQARPRASLHRRQVVADVLAGQTEAVVISGLGSPTWDLAAAGERERNYYLWGAMGGAVALGLGLALARKDLDVVVITGDGEMLMGMGSLATAAAKAPPNLSILVLDNGRYGETGQQPSHTGLGCDLTGVARGCGIADAWQVSNDEELQAILQRFRRRGSLRFLLARVVDEELERIMPTRDAVANKLRLREAIMPGS